MWRNRFVIWAFCHIQYVLFMTFGRLWIPKGSVWRRTGDDQMYCFKEYMPSGIWHYDYDPPEGSLGMVLGPAACGEDGYQGVQILVSGTLEPVTLPAYFVIPLLRINDHMWWVPVSL